MSSKPRGRVLLAEDNDDYREILADYLRHVGFDVSEKRDGAALLDTVFASDPPFVVLTDLFMAGTSGFDVVAALRQVDLLDVVPVAVISASASVSFDEAGVLAIDKPIEMEKLVTILEALCEDAESKAPVARVRLEIARRRRKVRA